MSTATETDSASAEEDDNSSSLPLMDDSVISDLASSVPAILREEIKPKEAGSTTSAPAPPPPRPTGRDKAEAEAMMLSKKLKTILSSVAGEESKLKQKLKAEQLRLKAIADTLCKASDVRGQLQAFDPYADAHRKGEINLLLDQLDDALARLNGVESDMHRAIHDKLTKDFTEKLESERKSLQDRYKEQGDEYEKKLTMLLEELTALKLDNADLKREKDTAIDRYQTMKEAMKQSETLIANLQAEVSQLNETVETNERLREEWTEQKKIKNEEISALMSRLEDIIHENDEYQHSISESHMERNKLSDELSVMSEEFDKCCTERDSFQAETEKLSKEKIVLIKEVKNLRSQRSELITAKESIVESLKNLHKEKLSQLSADAERTLSSKEKVLNRYRRRELAVLNLLNELMAKMSSLDTTLTNATVSVLRDTTPDMTERERFLKSSELIRQLSPMFTHSTDQLDEVLLSSEIKKGDSKRRSSSVSGSLDSSEADSVMSIEEKMCVNEHDLILRQLYQQCFELLCDKMTLVQKLNEAELMILSDRSSSSSRR